MTGKYDGIQWGELVAFQTTGAPGNTGLDGLPKEEQLLDLAAQLTHDAGYFATRAHLYHQQVRGLPWGGNTPREQVLAEMRRSLSFFLGHVINASKYLDADVLEEFVEWSRQIGAELPETPYKPRTP